MIAQESSGDKEKTSANFKIRWGWIKFMYVFTILAAGGFGLGAVFFPDTLISAMRMPGQDPIILGVLGSVYIACGILAVLGLRSPLKFVPLLLLQLFYKVIWFGGVLLPLLFSGPLPWYGMVFSILFAAFIIGDLIAIPFRYVFAR